MEDSSMANEQDSHNSREYVATLFIGLPGANKQLSTCAYNRVDQSGRGCGERRGLREVDLHR